MQFCNYFLLTNRVNFNKPRAHCLLTCVHTSRNNISHAGLFDQLLNAMNEDSSDDEAAGPSVSSGPSGNASRFEHENDMA